jgi:hypothetical protein
MVFSNSARAQVYLAAAATQQRSLMLETCRIQSKCAETGIRCIMREISCGRTACTNLLHSASRIIKTAAAVLFVTVFG